jgi:hypothetical protein
VDLLHGPASPNTQKINVFRPKPINVISVSEHTAESQNALQMSCKSAILTNSFASGENPPKDPAVVMKHDFIPILRVFGADVGAENNHSAPRGGLPKRDNSARNARRATPFSPLLKSWMDSP